MRAGTSALVAVLLLAVPLAGLAPSSAAQADPIQPGDPLTDVSGDSYCTLSYVFDDEGTDDVYLSTAAHCVTYGQTVHTEGHYGFGTVVFVGDEDDVRTDYALIQVDAGAREHVQASVRGQPDAPTGVAHPEDTMTGDLVHSSGWGTATKHSETTRENRTGVLTEHQEDLMRAETTVHFGDSGGPWTHQSGLALGIVSRLTISVGIGSEEVHVPIVDETVIVPMPHGYAADQGPTVAGLIADAGTSGYDVTLRTAS